MAVSTWEGLRVAERILACGLLDRMSQTIDREAMAEMNRSNISV